MIFLVNFEPVMAYCAISWAYVEGQEDRVRPQKGLKGICPACKSPVTAKCGLINVHHWAHAPGANCDPWYEPETEWHRQWKREFPEDWDEKVVWKEGVFHRADLLTPSGTVIEFQNSTIKAEVIQEREAFYGKMVWVVNAEPFYYNFFPHPILKDEIRQIRDSESYRADLLGRDIVRRYSDVERDLNEAKRQLMDFRERIKYNNFGISKINEKITDPSIFAEYVKEEVLNGSIPYDVPKQEVFAKAGISDLETVKNLERKRKAYQVLRQELESRLAKIEALPVAKHSSQLREYPVKWAKPDNYTKIVVIKKDDEVEGRLPSALHISSWDIFNSLVRPKVDTYSFYSDMTLDLEERRAERNRAKLLEEQTEYDLNNILNLIGDVFSFYLTERKLKLEAEVESFTLKIEELNNVIDSYEKRLLAKKSELTMVEQKAKEETERLTLQAHNESGNRYTFNWARRRKCWGFAKKKVFLDFGDWLFKLDPNIDNEAIAISRKDFIRAVRQLGTSSE